MVLGGMSFISRTQMLEVSSVSSSRGYFKIGAWCNFVYSNIRFALYYHVVDTFSRLERPRLNSDIMIQISLRSLFSISFKT